MLRPLLATLLLALAAPACDGGTGAVDEADAAVTGDVTSPYEADNFVAADTAVDEDAPAPIYPGHPCDDDDQCSTGLCWGSVSTKGAFQDKLCQVRCVPVEDFTRYCDSDADCCTGHCCVGCGPREGLCVQD
ncbi:MAG: hypothetical protein EP329_19255 [Deltaproteobacteria bacterium]|nr:MAG: hypothetical protein EP329_19255 [Deltaproteobacteria bacterium]